MRKFVPIMLIAVLVVGAGYALFVRTQRKPGIEGPVLSARFLDGRLAGTAVLRTPEGKVVVIDPPARRDFDALARLLRDQHVTEMTVVLSQSSSRRSADLQGLEQIARIDRVIQPEIGAAAESWETPAAKANAKSERTVAAARGDSLRLSPTVRLDVLNPARGAGKSKADALVFRVRFGEKSILFTSDIDREGEAALITSGQSLTSSVLVASRDEHDSSNSLELLSMVRPEIIVVATSDRPSTRLMSRMSARNTGAALYRTDKDGEVGIDTNGRSVQVVTEGGER